MDYVAIIHKDLDSDFGVSFSDFPGCITAGRTLDEAKDMALEALSGHIEVMREDARGWQIGAHSLKSRRSDATSSVSEWCRISCRRQRAGVRELVLIEWELDFAAEEARDPKGWSCKQPLFFRLPCLSQLRPPEAASGLTTHRGNRHHPLRRRPARPGAIPFPRRRPPPAPIRPCVPQFSPSK